MKVSLSTLKFEEESFYFKIWIQMTDFQLILNSKVATAASFHSLTKKQRNRPGFELRSQVSERATWVLRAESFTSKMTMNASLAANT